MIGEKYEKEKKYQEHWNKWHSTDDGLTFNRWLYNNNQTLTERINQLEASEFYHAKRLLDLSATRKELKDLKEIVGNKTGLDIVEDLQTLTALNKELITMVNMYRSLPDLDNTNDPVKYKEGIDVRMYLQDKVKELLHIL